jgi:hypothetical protein
MNPYKTNQKQINMNTYKTKQKQINMNPLQNKTKTNKHESPTKQNKNK